MALDTLRLSGSPSIFLVLLLLNVVVTSLGDLALDAQSLIKFKDSLENNGALSAWDAAKPIICEGDNSKWGDTIFCDNGIVWGIRLENLGLKGTINVDALRGVKTLKTISLMNNEFEGSFPDFKSIGSLRTLYLSDNKFQGDIPADAFDGMISLKKLYAANNGFTGQIPKSLAALPKLFELSLENNQFSGLIPDFSSRSIKIFNASNNNLEGQIPSVFSSFSVDSFSGNKGLCGTPLKPCKSSTTATKPSIATTVVLSILCFAAVSSVIVVIIILLRRKRAHRNNSFRLGGEALILQGHNRFASGDLDRMEIGSPDHAPGKRSPDNQNVKLSFLRNDRTVFDMTDLLKANAEILGNGVLGSTYKAAIVGGPTVVVKRYRHMNKVDRVEFCDLMRRVGRLSHKNLLPFVAFYYRKDEKLFVFDHVDNGSLTVYLQGNGSRHPKSLDWETRLRIIKGIARGLKYLHNELTNLVAPHGNLKSSNVLLDKETLEPILTDYAMVPLMDEEQAQQNLMAYKSPEFQQTGRLTKKTDVWGLGMLILEILTGKIPSTSWVQSIVGKDLKPELIDIDMPGKRGRESEMLKVLKIGLNCCEADIERRWDINEVVEIIEGIQGKESNVDDDFFSDDFRY